jgi:flagellar biosynthetic protein FlhB
MLVILLLVGALAGILQAGFYIAPEAITFKPERLSPVEGFGRLFSLQGGLRALTSILKMVAVVGIAWWILAPQLGTVAALGQGALSHSASEGWSLVLRVSLAIAGGLLVAGVIDYGFQWFRLERSLRMTRQELKEEIKREEGDPLIKGRIRRLQREAAQRRMLSEVPRSTVVITNPVHLAIALRYESGVTAAPRVVAKGAGRIAEEIVKRARANGVPVLERPELARVLFRAVPIDRDVPAGLYVAVAEILAYIYRIRGRRG